VKSFCVFNSQFSSLPCKEPYAKPPRLRVRAALSVLSAWAQSPDSRAEAVSSISHIRRIVRRRASSVFQRPSVRVRTNGTRLHRIIRTGRKRGVFQAYRATTFHNVDPRALSAIKYGFERSFDRTRDVDLTARRRPNKFPLSRITRSPEPSKSP
jgi:hypothetical protein